jgi:hypothetical protein
MYQVMKSLGMILLGVCLSVTIVSGQAKSWKQKTENPEYIHRSIKQVSDVIVYDIYSPPVASRSYAYICIAAYEALLHSEKGHRSFAGQLHDFKALPQPDESKEYSFTLAAANAILIIGKSMVISEEKVNDFKTQLLQEFKADGIPENVYNNSLLFGQQIADHILAWAANDNYKKSRSLPKYAVNESAGTWKPTPPAYMAAIEPNWNKLRTFVIDSPQQFKPVPATIFSFDKSSDFYKEAMAVHDIGVNLTAEQTAIASFWDCNPFKMNVRGHVMYATKKISPGGHWLNITRLACRKSGANGIQSAEAYACVAVVISDCFSSCWDEKYRSNVIRPETYINEYIDNAWMPLLQTPPFPEYTSGHSVVSGSAAVFLSKYFGNNFSFTDSTELEFGLPERHFNSFKQAAEEAAISRFYGGIHYMPSINNGLKEGEAIGHFITGKLKMKKEDVADK